MRGKGLLLALETSTLQGSVALVSPERIWAERGLALREDHSSTLLPAIQSLLGEAGCAARDLEGIAVASGPGSFTGLRIGVATAKGLAYALSVPLYAVPTLLALAAQMAMAALPVCPLLDARRRQVYAGLYQFREGETSELLPPMAIAPEELTPRLPGPVVFVGEGASVYRRLLEETAPKGSLFAPPALSAPRAALVGEWVHRRGEAFRVGSVLTFEPLYLRPPEALRRWERSSPRP